MKQALLLILLLPSLCLAQSFPSTPILDNFNRANEDPITGIWTNGLSDAAGECAVSSNVAVSGAAVGDCYTTATYGANQEVFVTAPNAGTMSEDNNLFICGCLQGTFGTTSINGYCVRARRVSGGNDIIRMVRMTGGYSSFTNLGSGWSSGELSNGLKYGIRIKSGGTMQLWYDPDGVSGWSMIEEITGETTYGCANTPLGMELIGAGPLDDFGGGAMPNAFMMILESK